MRLQAVRRHGLRESRKAVIRRSCFVAFVLHLTAATASAADDPGTLARRFVDLIRYEKSFTQYQEQCVATSRTVSPEALVAKNPDFFNGIRPGHVRWKQILTAYDAYYRQACARPTKDEFLALIAASYAASLSVAELKEVIAFYSSTTGQALVAASMKTTQAMYKAWNDANEKHLTEAHARYQREVSRIVRDR